MVIAVDFDGTIVEHKYPYIGKEMPYAFKCLRALQEKGFWIILWSYRCGDSLKEAVDYCESKGIKFYSVNRNFPEEKFKEGITSRKILADFYIDDRNINACISWPDIYKKITGEDINNN